MSISKMGYGVLVAIGVLGAILLPGLAIYFATIIFPVVALFMLYDIKDGLDKIWVKVWEIEEKLGEK